MRFPTFSLLAFPCLLHAGIDSGGGKSSGGATQNHSSIGAPFDTHATTAGAVNIHPGMIAVIYHLSSSSPTPSSPADIDQNGLPDSWESEHFGPQGADPAADPDHDGTSNLMEYLAGTDPNSASSAFRLSGALTGGIFRLPIPTLYGRQYQVWISRDLQSWTLKSTLAGNDTIQLFEFDETTITSGPLHSSTHPSTYFFQVQIMIP